MRALSCVAASCAFAWLGCSSGGGAQRGPTDGGLADATIADGAAPDATDVDASPPIAADAALPLGDAGLPYPGAASLPKFVSPLPIPPVWVPSSTVTDDAGDVVSEAYAIDVAPTREQVLPDGYARTKVYAYGGAARLSDGTVVPGFQSWPGATFEAKLGVPIDVTWTNALAGETYMFPVDPTICWANPNDAASPSPPFAAYPPGYPNAQSPIPLATHLHGGEDQSTSDGSPTDWFLPGASKTDHYPNAQRAATLWYHDHALGLTRLNTLAGLAGFYLLRDPADTVAATLPSGAYEIPLAIQDRQFSADGSIFVPATGATVVNHPYWLAEYFGDTIVVNGRTWPQLAAEPRAYRFRILNGSNARFYDLRLVDEGADAGASIPFVQIGSEGGYLPSPVVMSSLLLAPAERADVVVDLSPYAGHTLLVTNDAPAPYPNGTAPDPATTGQVLQIQVAASPVTPPPALPPTLSTVPTLTPDSPARAMVLVEPSDAFGQPLTMLLNGLAWNAPVSESPRVGSTEDWQIVNAGDEAHPIHLHLVEFQVVSRQALDAQTYLSAWMTLNGNPTLPLMTTAQPLSPASYLTGSARGPEANETGWKDTVIANLGEVLTIRVRFAPANATAPSAPGTNLFPFDPTVGPGYVWHCHILEHEDNQMMRPFVVVP
jgi:FtsP/CotA-like multicopper oxidase with cupredoxin domain